jgi:hypothetical protein
MQRELLIRDGYTAETDAADRAPGAETLEGEGILLPGLVDRMENERRMRHRNQSDLP